MCSQSLQGAGSEAGWGRWCVQPELMSWGRLRTGRGVVWDPVQGPLLLWTERPRLARIVGSAEEGTLVCRGSCNRSGC